MAPQVVDELGGVGVGWLLGMMGGLLCDCAGQHIGSVCGACSFGWVVRCGWIGGRDVGLLSGFAVCSGGVFLAAFGLVFLVF